MTISLRQDQYKWIRLRRWSSALSAMFALTTAGLAWAGHYQRWAVFMTICATVSLANAAFTFWQTRRSNLEVDSREASGRFRADGV